MILLRKTLTIETEGNLRGITDADLERISDYLDEVASDEMNKLQQFINLGVSSSSINIKITVV